MAGDLGDRVDAFSPPPKNSTCFIRFFQTDRTNFLKAYLAQVYTNLKEERAPKKTSLLPVF